jgi:gamma-butyrobetaine dioxygenase
MDALWIEEGLLPKLWWRSDGPDGEVQTLLPALWLRERSREPSQRDLTTNQRLVNSHAFDSELHLIQAQWVQPLGGQPLLQLGFSDDFSGSYDPADLLAATRFDEGTPATRSWRSDVQRHVYLWPQLLSDDLVLYSAVTEFIELGFLLIHDTPIRADAILEVASRFGHVRTTNFGAFFEVYSRPNSNDLAYRPVAIGPHTDNPYRTPVPGIQLLQCLQNETSGGLSTLVDSLAVAEQLRREDPAGFELLTRVPVRFEFQDPETHLVQVCPMIELDGSGQMAGVHYSPRLDDIPLMSDADTRAYHRARKRFGMLFDDPGYELRFKLDPGQLMMFDNNRVLHGRTSFDPSEGFRQLQGCYIDRDGPRSLYRVLKRKFESPTRPYTDEH